MTPEALEQAGWCRRFMVGPDRQKEVVETYEALGLTVRLEPLHPDAFSEKCATCAESMCSGFQMLYTRKPTEAAS
jgi:hypothetical protein